MDDEKKIAYFITLDSKEVAYLYDKTSCFFQVTDKDDVQVYGRVWSYSYGEWIKISEKLSEVDITEQFIKNYPIELSLLKEVSGALNKLWIKYQTKKK